MAKWQDEAKEHPAWEAFVMYREGGGYGSRVGAWLAGWLAFKAGYDSARAESAGTVTARRSTAVPLHETRRPHN